MQKYWKLTAANLICILLIKKIEGNWIKRYDSCSYVLHLVFHSNLVYKTTKYVYSDGKDGMVLYSSFKF